MDRRAFFSFLPLAPVIAGAALAEEANKDYKPSGPVPTLSLQQANWRTDGKERMRVGSNGLTFQPTWSEMERVDLSVGKDGKLWIRSVGEDWKRVVTE